MSDSATMLEHPLVRDYLRQLDEASAALTVARWRELREQITGHLEDALAPDAADDEVKAELTRLGPPRALVAEAAGIAPARFPALRKLRRHLGRVRWWVWPIVAVTVAALGTGSGFLVSMKTAAPLSILGTGWLYPADQAKEVNTTAGTVMQTLVPIRSGQRQGIEFGVGNYSDWTQTIVGVDPRWYSFGFVDIQVSVTTGPFMHQNGAARHGTPIYYQVGASIPPHSFRQARITWISELCLPQKTEETYFSDIPFLVKVGTVTRTEDLNLDGQTFALEGPSHGKCD